MDDKEIIKEKILQKYEELKQLLAFYTGRGTLNITIAEFGNRVAEIIKEIADLGFRL